MYSPLAPLPLNGLFFRAEDRSGPPRLLVILHGLGDSPMGFTWLPAALSLPWLDYLMLEAPDPYYSGYSWYDYENDPVPTIERSRGLIEKTLDLLATRGYEFSSIALSGFSQGCLMSCEVGLRLARPLGGILGMSGYLGMPERAAAEITASAKSTPWLLVHGTEDEVVPFLAGKKAADRIAGLGVSVEWHAFECGHTIPEDAIPKFRDFLARHLRPVSAGSAG